MIPVVGLSYVFGHVKYVSTKLAANKNAHCPLRVQARTHLQPAVDFFARAVVAAEGSDSLTGELLSSVSFTTTMLFPLLMMLQAAEASMNLGNVSSSSSAEQHFVRAVKYLRRTVTIPGYTLSTFFQE